MFFLNIPVILQAFSIFQQSHSRVAAFRAGEALAASMADSLTDEQIVRLDAMFFASSCHGYR